MTSDFQALLFDSMSLLAVQDPAPAAQPSPLMQQLLNPLNLILMSMILFFLLVVRPQRNDMKKMQQKLAALKKNDRVVTSGGIHGVVIQANSGEPTVVVRIDENSGARITINRDAIAKVLTDSEPEKK
jgi:preprotein translocase subunit YajC